MVCIKKYINSFFDNELNQKIENYEKNDLDKNKQIFKKQGGVL